MHRNLFVRLIALSLGVAVMAIAATAWITTQSTSERLRGTFERTLEGDSFVYGQLIAYGQENESWDGVGALVDELAARIGNRVALTEPDGTVLADSAAADGETPALPSTPTAEVDPMTPAAVMAGGMGATTPLAIASSGELLGEDVRVGAGGGVGGGAGGGAGTATAAPPDGTTPLPDGTTPLPEASTPMEEFTVHRAR